MNLFKLLANLALLHTLCVFAEQELESQNAIKILKSQEFDKFIESEDVRVAYFHKKDLRKEKNFFNEYENAAPLLKNYNVELAKVDCNNDPVVRYCDKDDVDQNLYVFRKGRELIPLTLETMFDVNSIMSNILQLVLLREVPILQSLEERKQVEVNYQGKTDVIYSYQSALGTYDHRVLMEIAYAYNHKYKFVITTEKDAVKDLSESVASGKAAFWVFRCKDAKKDEECKKSRYRGSLTLTSLASFFEVIDKQLIQEIDGKETQSIFGSKDLSIVYMLYDETSAEQVREAAQNLMEEFYGLIGIALVNVAKHGMIFEVPSDLTIPLVGIRLADRVEKDFMPYVFSKEATVSFIGNKLSEIVKTFQFTDTFNGENDGISDEDLDAAERQDDPVAAAVFRLRNRTLDMTHVPALTDKTFYPTTQSAKLLIVLHYLTFDARSMAFLRYYVDASHELAEQSSLPLARIDCYDWTDVCGKENITTYPTIRVFRKGKETVTYKGILDKVSIIDTVKLFEAGSPVKLSDLKEVKAFAAGQRPTDILHHTHISVVGLFHSSDSEGNKAFLSIAQTLEGQLMFGVYTGAQAAEVGQEYKVGVPAVLLFNRGDTYQPLITFSKRNEMTEEKIMDFVTTNRLAIFPQLTVHNFPAYFAKKRPIALLFDHDVIPGTGLNLQVGNIAKSGRFPEMTFAWLDAKSQGKLISHVLTAYDPSATPPAFAVVNHKLGTVHMYSGEMTSEPMSDWLEKVRGKEIQPTSMLQKGEWKPLHPGYDFLKLMKQELNKPTYEADEDEVYNEENISYDRNGKAIEKGNMGNKEEEEAVRRDLLRLHQFRGHPSKHTHPKPEHTEL